MQLWRLSWRDKKQVFMKHTQAQVFIPGREKGGDPGGNVGGEEEEVATERMLKCKIAQQIAEVQEQICSFLRHGEG